MKLIITANRDSRKSAIEIDCKYRDLLILRITTTFETHCYRDIYLARRLPAN
jgi:hypothetical protein